MLLAAALPVAVVAAGSVATPMPAQAHDVKEGEIAPPHVALKEAEILAHHLGLLGLDWTPPSKPLGSARVVTLTVRVEKTEARLQVDRLSGDIHILDVPPQAEKALLARIPRVYLVEEPLAPKPLDPAANRTLKRP